MIIEFSGINVVRDGLLPGKGPRFAAAARDYLRDEALPIDVDDLRRRFRSAEDPFEPLRPEQVPDRASDTDIDTFMVLLVGLWNHTPFDGLGGRTPAEAIAAGERPARGPAALAASLVEFLGAPGGSPASFLEGADIPHLVRVEDWLFVPLACMGRRSVFEAFEAKRLPATPDPSDLPPAGKRLRSFDQDLQLLASPNDLLRNCAMIRLSQSGDPRTRETLLRLLDDPCDNVVYGALDFLADRWPGDARDAVVERLAGWRRRRDVDLSGRAEELLAAAGRPEDLRRLVEDLEGDRAGTSWVPLALPALDDELRRRASASIAGRATERGPELIDALRAVVLLGIRRDVAAVAGSCLLDLRHLRAKGFPWEDLVDAAGVDVPIFRGLAHALGPGPASVPWVDRHDTSAIPIEPDRAFVAAFCHEIGEPGEEFLRRHQPGESDRIVGDVAARIAQAAEASVRRNPAFAATAASLCGLADALAGMHGRNLVSSRLADHLLALGLGLLARAVGGRAPREELAVLGENPAPAALLELHVAERLSEARFLDGPLARHVEPQALVDTLSSSRTAVRFRAARALIAGHGELHLQPIECVLWRSYQESVELLDWARRRLGDAVLLPAARLFGRFPAAGTAGLLARTCAALATERSLAVFGRYAEALLESADEGDLAWAVLVLGDRPAAERHLLRLEREGRDLAPTVAEDLVDMVEAIRCLHGLDDLARRASRSLRKAVARDPDSCAEGTPACDLGVAARTPSSLASRAPAPPPRVEPLRRAAAKVSRNGPCPCGSGRKYKNCCGR